MGESPKTLDFCIPFVYNGGMKEKPPQTRKFGKLFYIVLLLLTAALLALLGFWAGTKRELYLYLMIGVVPLYLFHLVFHLIRTDKDYKKRDALKSAFATVAREERAAVVYLTYLGNERRVKKPSQTKKDYLIEFYAEGVDLSLLKRHLWFDLKNEEEEAIARFRLGSMDAPYPFLEEIEGKTLLVQSEFYRAAEGLTAFERLFSKNKTILYGE